jgi:hypothetical protein
MNQLERDGWLIRWGEGWVLSAPLGAVVHVDEDDTPAEPLRRWRSREEREAP